MKNKLLKLFEMHGYGKLFELTLSVGEASEILLQLHSSNRLLDESMIGLWAAKMNSGDFLEVSFRPIIINPNGFMITDGAFKLAGFIESNLKEITLQVVFSEESP